MIWCWWTQPTTTWEDWPWLWHPKSLCCLRARLAVVKPLWSSFWLLPQDTFNLERSLKSSSEIRLTARWDLKCCWCDRRSSISWFLDFMMTSRMENAPSLLKYWRKIYCLHKWLCLMQCCLVLWFSPFPEDFFFVWFHLIPFLMVISKSNMS